MGIQRWVHKKVYSSSSNKCIKLSLQEGMNKNLERLLNMTLTIQSKDKEKGFLSKVVNNFAKDDDIQSYLSHSEYLM